MTKKTVGRYRPEAACPSWDTVLIRQFPDLAERHWVEVLLAYAALRDGNYRKLVVLLSGATDTGKSQLVEALGHALGSYAASFERSLLTDTGSTAKPRPDLIARMRCRFVYTTEVDDQQPLAASYIKRLTGGDTMSARGLYSNTEFSGRPGWTPVLAVNGVPEMNGLDLATKRRIIVIDFPNSVPVAEQNHALPKLLRDEADGILTRLVGRLADEDLLFDVPPRFQVATQKATDEMSPVARFIAEETVEVPGAVVTNAAVAERYKAWCVANNVRDTLSNHQLGRQLQSLGWPADRHYIEGKMQRTRTGREFWPNTPADELIRAAQAGWATE